MADTEEAGGLDARADPRERDAMRRAIEAMLEERDYQARRWTPEDDQARSPEEWLSILTTWLGKAGNECPAFRPQDDQSRAAFRKRIVQLGAICLAVLEATE